MVESELLFTELLNYSRDRLYLNKDRILTRQETSFLANALRRRALGEPIQYILGKTDFMGLEFRLTPDVFIPRPETEILVETVIDLATSHKPQATSFYIMDIGTGSGNIAVSLAKFLKECQVVAIDISQEVIGVAKNNALLNGVVGKINFINHDFFNLKFAACGLRLSSFDFIVSNPPYIPSSKISNFDPELDYEPGIALDGGRDGLDFYRRIIQSVPAYLKEDGCLILEIGFKQSPAIKRLFKSIERFKIIEVIKDYNNIDRVIVARYG